MNMCFDSHTKESALALKCTRIQTTVLLCVVVVCVEVAAHLYRIPWMLPEVCFVGKMYTCAIQSMSFCKYELAFMRLSYIFLTPFSTSSKYIRLSKAELVQGAQSHLLQSLPSCCILCLTKCHAIPEDSFDLWQGSCSGTKQ